MIAPVGYGDLEDIAVLVHVLSCYMHEEKVIAIIRCIGEKMAIEGTCLQEKPQFNQSQNKYQGKD